MQKGVINSAIVAAAVALGIGLSLKPWHVFLEQRKSAHMQVAEMHRMEQQRILDLQRAARIGSSLGREELARQLGYHRQNEVPVPN